MSLLAFIKRNRIFAFITGLLIFVILIPGGVYLTNNFLAAVNKPNTKLTLATENSFSKSTSSLGVGLNGIADWSTQLPFLDAFKSSRAWFTQCVSGEPDCNGEFSTEEANLLDLDENGWVKSLPAPEAAPKYTRVSTLLLREIPNRYPSGKYIVLYEGEGTLEYNFDAKKDQAASTPGRDVINVDATGGGGILLSITSTDPNKTGNYIRNIRVVQAEYESRLKAEVFNPKFIEKVNKFRAIRFMDWMKTNNSEQKEWSNRPRPENSSYALKGAPVEIMVALSNQIKADPWFNIPHMATDEYITKFAQLVKDSLDPNLKAYIELSNEVWNWQFAQSHYALEQGKAKWGQDKADAFYQWYGMRTAQMCDTWKNVFGNASDRVVCVMSTQRPYKGLENYALDCSYWVAEGNKPCYQHGIDVYAITGYFSGLGGFEDANTVKSWLTDPDGGFGKAIEQIKSGNLFRDRNEDSLPNAKKLYQYHANVAQQRGLKMVAYEGGASIAGSGGGENDEILTNFLIEVNRHPGMYDIYLQALNDWKESGGTLFMQFVDVSQPSKWGSWGALEYVEQNGSPKYNALMKFIDTTPCWWDDCARNLTQNKSLGDVSTVPYKKSA